MADAFFSPRLDRREREPRKLFGSAGTAGPGAREEAPRRSAVIREVIGWVFLVFSLFFCTSCCKYGNYLSECSWWPERNENRPRERLSSQGQFDKYHLTAPSEVMPPRDNETQGKDTDEKVNFGRQGKVALILSFVSFSLSPFFATFCSFV